MTGQTRRVVITGLGVLTPLGLDLPSQWAALEQGRSAIRRLRFWDTSALPIHIGGEIDGFEPRQYIAKSERKRLGVMPRGIQLAVAGAHGAMQDAGVQPGQLEPTRFGVIFGSGTISHDLSDLGPVSQLSYHAASGYIDMQRWGRDGLATIPPLWMLNHVPNMPACHVSMLHDAQGPCNTITQTELGGVLSLGEAYRMIQHDRGDFFLCGGGDSRVDYITVMRYGKFFEMAQRNDDPERACRPFDRDRDGMVLSEGAGVLALEALEHAERRGARIHAEVVGFASGFDRRRDGGGLARVCGTALREAGLAPAALDHINAHGAATQLDDIWEARGLSQLAPATPVLALRGYIGTLTAGAGLAELGISLQALARGVVPRTLNCDNIDPNCPINVLQALAPVQRAAVLKVSCTEMGQCAAVVCRKWE